MWNVEGLGADQHKVRELMWHMKQRRLAILCIQETHITGIHHYNENGFLVILSGGSTAECSRSYAGVGFIVAPSAVPPVQGFCTISDRLAKLKFKATAGIITLISAYAPHSGNKYEVRTYFSSS